MTKKVMKRKIKDQAAPVNEPQVTILPATRMSDEPPLKKVKWINKQRVLVFATRGISHRHRHLMDDLKTLMPHHRPECKMERSSDLQIVNEMCQMKNCSKAVLFEGRRKRDLYVWLSNASAGPCAKFLVENIYTMAELKMTGNCLRGSRPLLSFDEQFNTKPHFSLLKELFIQIFGVPNHHPKSQPFFDHVYTFTVLDDRIWFRNFQILTEDGGLAEIGPRFVLNPVKIFGESFGGETLWNNPTYISPAKYRQSLTKTAANKYKNRVEQKMIQEANKPKEYCALNPLDEIFTGDPLEKALEVQEKEATISDTSSEKKIGKKMTKKVVKKSKKNLMKASVKKLAKKSEVEFAKGPGKKPGNKFARSRGKKPGDKFAKGPGKKPDKKPFTKNVKTRSRTGKKTKN